MKLNELDYPLRLCVEVLHYCAFSTKFDNKVPNDILLAVSTIFSKELAEEARKILTKELE